MKPHSVNQHNNFIAGWFMNDLNICDDLIHLIEKSKEKYTGLTGTHKVVNKLVKDSTDLSIHSSSFAPPIKSYLKELSNITKEYKKKYLYSDKDQCGWGIVESFNIQRYLPKQGYHALHYERNGIKSSSRLLTFMTYLNDVNDGGETEYYYQKVKIKPVKGLTLIVPVDWTFTHRGIVSLTETKYIVTGWFSYLG